MSMSFKASPDGTFGEILVNGQVVAKLPVTGNAVIPGLVGTVSQSGGVPTGAVVERGSNANGEYVRFADGTQICTNYDFTLPSSNFIPITNGFGLSGTWTFPAPFVSSATAIVNARQDIGADSPVSSDWDRITFGKASSGAGSSSVTQWFQGSYTSGKSQRVQLIAIGRWF